MGRGKLTSEEIRILSKNPYVVSVNEDRIVYSDAFKKYFVKQYFMGEKPRDIFRSAGFDLKILGSKRVERASYRWRESFEAGTLGIRIDARTMDKEEYEDDEGSQEGNDKDVADAEEINDNKKLLWKILEEQKKLIVELRSEIKHLRKINSRLMKELDKKH